MRKKQSACSGGLCWCKRLSSWCYLGNRSAPHANIRPLFSINVYVSIRRPYSLSNLPRAVAVHPNWLARNEGVSRNAIDPFCAMLSMSSFAFPW